MVKTEITRYSIVILQYLMRFISFSPIFIYFVIFIPIICNHVCLNKISLFKFLHLMYTKNIYHLQKQTGKNCALEELGIFEILIVCILKCYISIQSLLD